MKIVKQTLGYVPKLSAWETARQVRVKRRALAAGMRNDNGLLGSLLTTALIFSNRGAPVGALSPQEKLKLRLNLKV